MNRIVKNIVYHMPWMLSDRRFLELFYELQMGKTPDLDNPETFNEKIQWLKLHDRDPRYNAMVEKGMAKEWAAGVIGSEHIIPTIGIYNKVEDIPWENLPQQFVLKCTHDSGGMVICRDKSKLDISAAKAKLRKGLKQNFYMRTREWVYKDIPHRIICEQMMEPQSKDGLTDYKFFCFGGKAEFMYISAGLEDHSTARISFTDLQGNILPFCRADYRSFSQQEIPQPQHPEKMREIAEKLAAASKAKFVRVDLYEIDGQIYFSEMTFYPNSGYIPFTPAEWDLLVGKYLQV